MTFTHFFEHPSFNFDSFDSNVFISFRNFSNPKINFLLALSCIKLQCMLLNMCLLNYQKIIISTLFYVNIFKYFVMQKYDCYISKWLNE